MPAPANAPQGGLRNTDHAFQVPRRPSTSLAPHGRGTRMRERERSPSERDQPTPSHLTSLPLLPFHAAYGEPATAKAAHEELATSELKAALDGVKVIHPETCGESGGRA